MATTDGLTQAEFDHVAHNLMAVKMYSLASFFMLFYDILITFGDEVEYIWKKKFTRFTLLWFLNRYVSPIGFVVIIISFHNGRWTKDNGLCDKVVFFPEILRAFTTSVIGAIFITRLYATYARNNVILILMTSLLVLEESVKIWSFTGGRRLELPAGLVGCILTTGPDSLRFTFTWIAELFFDSTVFMLTLYRTITFNRTLGGGAHSLMRLIFRDGIVYFAVISVANLFTVLTFLLAPPDLKAVNASFTVSITTLMVSRLILNLRSADSTSLMNTTDIEIMGGGVHGVGAWRDGLETDIDGDIMFASRIAGRTTINSLSE